MRLRGWMCCAVWLVVLQSETRMQGQTRVDIRTQGREANFGAYNYTKPFKTGSSLPGTCSVGEAFFRTGVTPGQNLYVCTALDTWTQVVGSGGGGTGLEVLSSTPWTTDGRLVVTDGATGRNVKQIPISYDGLNLVIPGGLSVGSGLSTGLQWTLGNPGDTGASSLVVRGGDGAANSEPGYLSAFSSHPSSPFQSFLFPCGSAGKWCPSAMTPGADSTDFLLSVANSATVQNKTLDSSNKFSSYHDVTAIPAPAYPSSGNFRIYGDSASGKLACRDSYGDDCMPSAGGNHNLLSSTHADAATGAVARGDLVAGQGASAQWQRLALGSSGQYLRSDGTDALWNAIQGADLPANARYGSVQFILDGGGSAIPPGERGWIRVPYSGTLTAWELTADQSGSITLDVWKDTYANFPPTAADTIWGAKPSLSSQQKNSATGLSISVSPGDYLRLNVDSASTVTYVVLSLQITRS